MEISQLEKSIANAAIGYGYTPLIASEEGLERAIKKYPTAWIQLPKVLYVEGREQGVICHKMTIALLDDYSAYSFEDKRDRLAQMEADMIDIAKRLSLEEGIVEIDSMSISPRITHTTRHGDIAQICEATIVSYF